MWVFIPISNTPALLSCADTNFNDVSMNQVVLVQCVIEQWEDWVTTVWWGAFLCKLDSSGANMILVNSPNQWEAQECSAYLSDKNVYSWFNKYFCKPLNSTLSLIKVQITLKLNAIIMYWSKTCFWVKSIVCFSHKVPFKRCVWRSQTADRHILRALSCVESTHSLCEKAAPVWPAAGDEELPWWETTAVWISGPCCVCCYTPLWSWHCCWLAMTSHNHRVTPAKTQENWY